MQCIRAGVNIPLQALYGLFGLQANADKAASDKTIAETGQKPMKTEATPQI